MTSQPCQSQCSFSFSFFFVGFFLYSLQDYAQSFISVSSIVCRLQWYSLLYCLLSGWEIVQPKDRVDLSQGGERHVQCHHFFLFAFVFYLIFSIFCFFFFLQKGNNTIDVQQPIACIEIKRCKVYNRSWWGLKEMCKEIFF